MGLVTVHVQRELATVEFKPIPKKNISVLEEPPMGRMGGDASITMRQ